MTNLTCKQKLMHFTETPQSPGKHSACPNIQALSQKSIKRTKKSCKGYRTWERKSFWNYFSLRDEHAQAVTKSITLRPSIPRLPQTRCKWDYWENTPSVTSIPIIRKIPKKPFLTAVLQIWSWNIYSMERKATTKTLRQRSILF